MDVHVTILSMLNSDIGLVPLGETAKNDLTWWWYASKQKHRFTDSVKYQNIRCKCAMGSVYFLYIYRREKLWFIVGYKSVTPEREILFLEWNVLNTKNLLKWCTSEKIIQWSTSERNNAISSLSLLRFKLAIHISTYHEDGKQTQSLHFTKNEMSETW